MEFNAPRRANHQLDRNIKAAPGFASRWRPPPHRSEGELFENPESPAHSKLTSTNQASLWCLTAKNEAKEVMESES